MTDDSQWDGMRHLKVELPDHVVYRGFAHETVLLNVKTGEYHGLDRVGSRFFDVIQAASTLELASATLAVEYAQPPEQIENDLAAFCGDLRDRELIRFVADGAR